jgi:uncharacterized repeat protein (TIGR03803 family)
MKLGKIVNTLGPILPVVLMATVVLAPSAWGQSKYKTLHAFTGKDGANLRAGVIFDQKGNLYGTTAQGGAKNKGTVFKLTSNPDGSWTESKLYSFCSVTNCVDGFFPSAGLIFDQAGNLYGTTAGGGVVGGGTAFKLTPNQDGSWTESVLYSFCSVGNCADGSGPAAGLIFDAVGNLYSTTEVGGTSGCAAGCGVAFQLKPNQDGSWTENVLYTFCSMTNCSDGAEPVAGFTFDATGSLYGTTVFGGANSKSCGGGCGTVFQLTPNGGGTWKEQVLHAFTGRDGEQPRAGVIFDQTGNLYGTTLVGSACNNGCGTVFKLSSNSGGTWKESVLHTFKGSRDGGAADAGLIFDAGGNLYGTTLQGGGLGCATLGCGAVFKLSPNGKGGWRETTLHAFHDRPGIFPEAGVIFDGAGNLYGTTFGDTVHTFGSVFEITP